MSTKNVKLKGTKEGYTIVLHDVASFEEILIDLEELLLNISKQNNASTEISVHVDTENRLLSDEQLAKVYQLVEQHSTMKIGKVQTNVLTKEAATLWKESENVATLVTTVRNGQVVTMPGDVMLLGSIHQGGTLKAAGNIYLFGELKGIVHAGYLGDEDKVVFAKFNHDAQVRIGEQVQIIEGKGKNEPLEDTTFAYVNDLHILSFDQLDQIRAIKPKLGNQTGGLL
ncbi:septum site-determining protein MinC [Isobaculum melis]|uniref:Probable septum site-determining protein MinC n=1 Tax=Isobaculum melis TaxID=142588 RepID=A0A1H9RGK7_9LACT|nr:septum site-determining protein MinC [Isobaculum melis]SER71876.1 septum site-determining protein MinC [Isobaculum melis]